MSPVQEACADLRNWQTAKRNDPHAVIIRKSTLEIWRLGINAALQHAAAGRADLALKGAIEVRDMIAREIES